MIELVLPSDIWETLRTRLLVGPEETCAIIFARQVTRRDGLVRLLVREVELPTSDDYTHRGCTEAELKPEVVARVTKRARLEDYSITFVHSHPGSSPPFFSDVDDDGEAQLSAFLARRHPNLLHAAMVVSKGGARARRLGTANEISVLSLGAIRDVLFDPQAKPHTASEMFDRQIRAFGATGQKLLGRLRFGIVGLGGTGSLVAQQLAHLGVQNFLLIDPDTLEATNLNRVVGAKPQDIGSSKVDVAERMIQSINPAALIERVQGDVIYARTATSLVNVDVIFGCTDSHGSRSILQQVAYQYLIPYFDVGTVLAVSDSGVTHISGQARLLAPGLACHTCCGFLNPEEVRRDLMTPFERQADPYIVGMHEPAPAVISINSTTTSLAVTMLLSVALGVPGAARHVLYDGIKPALRAIRAIPDPNCYICSRKGVLAQGDAWPLLARQD